MAGSLVGLRGAPVLDGYRMTSRLAFAKIILVLLMTCALFLNSSRSFATESKGLETVTAARLGVHGDQARFVLELSSKIAHTLSYSAAPDRITIEMPAVQWEHRQTSGRAKSGLIASYHYSSAKGGKAHIVLVLREPARAAAVNFLPPDASNHWRFVLDLAPTSAGDFKDRVAQSKPMQPEASAVAVHDENAKTAPPKDRSLDRPSVPAQTSVVPAPPVVPPPLAKTGNVPSTGQKPIAQLSPAPTAPAAPPANSPQQSALIVPTPPRSGALPPVKPPAARPHKPIIIIDPGHGGADPGAQAADGTKEKDLVLNVALALAKKLEQSGRYTPLLTRSTDSTVKLRERVEFSRNSHGELFISLHANIYEKSPVVNGLSVYTLSDKASSTAAAALARLENRADILAGIDLSNENSDVTQILIDLAQHETLGRSVQFAHHLTEVAAASTRLEKNATPQASLVVLKAPDIPSVLIELGYLTNAEDLARMKSDPWIEQFCDAIVTAADREFHGKDEKRMERAALP